MPATASAIGQRTADLQNRITALVDALEAHSQWNKTNPKESQKSIYWVWDFVNRTGTILQNISIPDLEAKKPAPSEQYKDVMGRCFMSKSMICDASGKTLMLMTMGMGQAVDFGPQIKELAENLMPK